MSRYMSRNCHDCQGRFHSFPDNRWLLLFGYLSFSYTRQIDKITFLLKDTTNIAHYKKLNKRGFNLNLARFASLATPIEEGVCVCVITERRAFQGNE